uniref:Protein regulator of cytokinesis 1 n=1 Tax=Acrobeloides nanus TaxID=290746 RepID=A0A914E4D6_9BILA
MASPSRTEPRSAMKRRVSVDNTLANLLNKIHSTMARLNELWNEVSMEERARVSRIEHAYGHFYNLLDDIIRAEEDMVAGVYSDIEGSRLAVSDIRRELGLEAFNESLYAPHSVALLKAMDRDLVELKELKREKLAYQQELIREYENICTKLGIESDRFLADQDHLLSAEELHSLQLKKIDLGVELQQIELEVKNWQEETRRIYEKIGADSLSPVQSNILYTDISESVFSPEIRVSFQQLFEKAQADYEKWVAISDFEYAEMMILLKDLWNKCAIPEENRTFPERFNPETQSHTDIDALRKEIAYLQQRYEECRPIFDKLNHWLSLFKEKQELDERYSTDALFNNRGGSLNNILKRQNQLAKLLPKALSELQTSCHTYEKSHNGKCVYVDGMPANQYAEWVMRSYEQQKEINRRIKQEQKKEKLEREMMYGTTPVRDSLARTRQTASSIKKSNRLPKGGPENIIADRNSQQRNSGFGLSQSGRNSYATTPSSSGGFSLRHTEI